MPKNISAQNKFTRGLITEAHGLNFPEDACTATDNCVFTLIGEVTRRLGIDLEENSVNNIIPYAGGAISSFKWTNAGGDGKTELVVLQAGDFLYFFESSASTVNNPVSAQKINSTVNISLFAATGTTDNPSLVECTYATGNGYLFVFHPFCDPFY